MTDQICRADKRVDLASDAGPRVIGVSACLLGANCRYDGCSKPSPELLNLAGDWVWMPFCPEFLAGMGAPRASIEFRLEKKVRRMLTSDGRDVTRPLTNSCRKIASALAAVDCRAVVLKERSPSCGYRQTHQDGQVINGPGMLAPWLARRAIRIYTEESISEFLSKEAGQQC